MLPDIHCPPGAVCTASGREPNTRSAQSPNVRGFPGGRGARGGYRGERRGRGWTPPPAPWLESRLKSGGMQREAALAPRCLRGFSAGAPVRGNTKLQCVSSDRALPCLPQRGARGAPLALGPTHPCMRPRWAPHGELGPRGWPWWSPPLGRASHDACSQIKQSVSSTHAIYPLLNSEWQV